MKPRAQLHLNQRIKLGEVKRHLCLSRANRRQNFRRVATVRHVGFNPLPTTGKNMVLFLAAFSLVSLGIAFVVVSWFI